MVTDGPGLQPVARGGRGLVVRDVKRRLRAALWVAVVAGIVAALSPRLVAPHLPLASGRTKPSAPATFPVIGASSTASATAGLGTGAVTGKSAPSRRGGRQGTVPPRSGAAVAGTFIPATLNSADLVPVARPTPHSNGAMAPLHRLLTADLLVVAPHSLPRSALAAVRRQAGVTAAQVVDAARVRVKGGYIAVLGVDPSQFREFAARPTARSNVLWQNVEGGAIAVSYLMGQQERLPLGGTIAVTGVRTERLRIGGFGTVGISGVDAVVSDKVALSLGMPAGNAIVVSAPHARLSVLIGQLGKILPRGASVAPLVAQAAGLPVTTGSAGGADVTVADGPGLTAAQTRAFLAAAESRIGDPYVWGGAGPTIFDCSGLVQWSMRQAGIVMPRVAVDQAMTGPLIPVSELQPGDLLFYHTDPTAPTYISHVAIYLGDDLMLQAPEPGMDVQVVHAVFDGGFAGAVEVYPRVAAAVAAQF
jgi:peptidoglycan DL-endopeptidase CwlO